MESFVSQSGVILLPAFGVCIFKISWSDLGRGTLSDRTLLFMHKVLGPMLVQC